MFVSFEIIVFIDVIVYHFAKLKVVPKSPCCDMIQQLVRLFHMNKVVIEAESDNDRPHAANYFNEDREPLLATDK